MRQNASAKTKKDADHGRTKTIRPSQLGFSELCDKDDLSEFSDTVSSVGCSIEQYKDLSEIESLDFELSQHFKNEIEIKPSLTRQIVSFQANKTRVSYRWFKYKEAFSAALIEYLLNEYGILNGKVLDPFAGSGTTLFSASSKGLDAVGVELLPIGQEIIETRICLEKDFNPDDFSRLECWVKKHPWDKSKKRLEMKELRITKGAYPDATMESIKRYLSALTNENERVQKALRFALLCILESISYTRKDGQYLRWDYRSGRQQGNKPFDKGVILEFNKSICEKIIEIIHDVRFNRDPNELFQESNQSPGIIKIFPGSCLDMLPRIKSQSYDAIITSPPYCNRYDYTRTYALELALLGIDEQSISDLRQKMLSCTVENRKKDLISLNPNFEEAIKATDKQALLQRILKYLEDQKYRKKLNNNGIPRMVKGYFYEMACVIFECFRVMKPNARLFMVNDNVRYAGASISVDMILSNIAEMIGFHVEKILVLPNGKGNSSQQMGEHGRSPLRKCVYVWRKGGL
ncbi:MAG: DNA methyltransferase [bacterium]